MRTAVELLPPPAVLRLSMLLVWARQRNRVDLWNRIVAGLLVGYTKSMRGCCWVIRTLGRLG
jgi:hypothetical protein